MKLNKSQAWVIFTVVVMLAMSLMWVPVISRWTSFVDGHETVEHEWISLEKFTEEPRTFTPQYTLNMPYLASEWVMIGVVGAFGLFLAGATQPNNEKIKGD